MTDTAVQVKGLWKSYGTTEAVKGVELAIAVGEVFALLGPNGAGKTTTVEILEGHRARDAGEVSVLGHDPARNERAFKRRIGIVLQETGVEPYLTVAEAIDLYRGYYPMPRALDEIIEVVGLSDKRDERVARLSGGQQRRLDVAIGLAGDPELLFLDEPTTGFDPGARRTMWTAIENLTALGKTVFLTTHYMDEAQKLADRVAVIVGGQIVAEGPPDTIAGRDADATMIRFRVPEGIELPASLGEPINGYVSVQTTETTKALHELTTWALNKGIDLQDLAVTRPSLEDVYLRLTEHQQEAE